MIRWRASTVGSSEALLAFERDTQLAEYVIIKNYDKREWQSKNKY